MADIMTMIEIEGEREIAPELLNLNHEELWPKPSLVDTEIRKCAV